MKMPFRTRATLIATFAISTFAALGAQQQSADPPGPTDDRFKFKSRVELVNVTATVSDASGRFVSGLQKDDFRVYEDNELQTVTHFNADRVPVSLGIVLDTSSSMSGEKIDAARRALEGFLADLTIRTTNSFSIASAIIRFSSRGGPATVVPCRARLED